MLLEFFFLNFHKMKDCAFRGDVPLDIWLSKIQIQFSFDGSSKNITRIVKSTSRKFMYITNLSSIFVNNFVLIISIKLSS